MNEAVVLVKARTPPEFEQMAKKFNFDLMWTTPLKVTIEIIVYSFIGDDDSIRKMVQLLKAFGETVKISVQEASFSGSEMLSSLTPKQKELLLEANRLGYYNYPRTTKQGNWPRRSACPVPPWSNISGKRMSVL